MGDAEGAGKDAVAARFRAAPAKVEPDPAKPAQKAEPKSDPAKPATTLPSSPTAAATAPPQNPEALQKRAHEANQLLLKEYARATPERKAAIKVEMEKNRSLVAPPT
jgi:hypothetical protein